MKKLRTPFRVFLNRVATECFRDRADEDYILARSAYRMDLREPFLWSSLQSIEKYLKATLLYNKQPAKFSHDLIDGLSRVRRIPILDVQMPKGADDYIRYLTRYGQNRYLSMSTYTKGDELHCLDMVVWHLRRYCQPFGVIGAAKGRRKPSRKLLAARVNHPNVIDNPTRFGIPTGHLEKILRRKPGDQARQALVWKNLFFGNHGRESVTYLQRRSSHNSPIWRYARNDKRRLNALRRYIKL